MENDGLVDTISSRDWLPMSQGFAFCSCCPSLEVGQGLQRFDAEGANLHSLPKRCASIGSCSLDASGLLLSRFAIDIIACLHKSADCGRRKLQLKCGLKDDCKQLFELGTVPLHQRIFTGQKRGTNATNASMIVEDSRRPGLFSGAFQYLI